MTGPTLPPINIKALLQQINLRPSKGLGQNFLKDQDALKRIVAAADLEPTDAVLEIGPGLGSLTRYLALASKSVTAVELDDGLFPALQSVLSPYPNVRLVHGDILKLSPAELGLVDGYLVVANIPYYITSAIIRHLLSGAPRPQRMVLTVQSEVAARICAMPGEMSLLALSVQVFGRPQVVAQIPATAFYPSPKVDSAVVRLDIYTQPVIPSEKLDSFFRLAKAGFSQKRKTLRNSLAGGMRLDPPEAQAHLEAAGLDPRRRAETLDLQEWGKLVEAFYLQERHPVAR